MSDFRKDVLLLLSNCKTFNQAGSDIYMDADELEIAFLTAYQRGSNGQEISLGEPLQFDRPIRPVSKIEPDDIKSETSQQTTAPMHPFFEVIFKNDVQKVQKALALDPSLLTLFVPMTLFGETFTWTAMHAAAYNGSGRIIEELVKRGADIEVEDTWYKGRPLAWVYLDLFR